MIAGSICRGLAHMPDEDLEFALTRPEAFRAASVSGKVTVWGGEVDGMLVRVQRRGDGSWLRPAPDACTQVALQHWSK